MSEKKIKRYSISPSPCYMYEDPYDKGEWVKYEDVVGLINADIKERENHIDYVRLQKQGIAAFWDACCRYRQKGR